MNNPHNIEIINNFIGYTNISNIIYNNNKYAAMRLLNNNLYGIKLIYKNPLFYLY